MKKLFGLLCCAALFACDKIDNPIPEQVQLTACEVEFPDLVPFTTRRVLIEDYTGHKCGNCPAAALEAKRIEQKYPNDVVVMGVHAGFFAEYRSSGKYSTDFTCEASEKWDLDFGISAVGNPNGMVNRLDNGGNKVVAYPDWESKATQFIGRLADLELNVAAKINDDKICGQAFIQPLTKLDSNLAINIVLLEDSIVDWQKNYKNTGGDPNLPDGDVPDYVHNHVLRKSFNGPYGTLLTGISKVPTDSIFPIGIETQIDSTWRKSKLSVVAFVYDINSKEVLQVAKAKAK
ncbi:Omp28-related outer membrane protein [Luteibaculum oceani]|uniref:Omp28-related outer membrane protein n=1 Tax=Luteibaculum oceani TaxID=1294296 RepID=A0A5C6VL47_9FLAO|nr:Omp28-related outer membrane protein [Luteibaculum oceani]TXC85066.1 Omp28-related outer membrane protein [Luteibaculum oceani]